MTYNKLVEIITEYENIKKDYTIVSKKDILHFYQNLSICNNNDILYDLSKNLTNTSNNSSNIISTSISLSAPNTSSTVLNNTNTTLNKLPKVLMIMHTIQSLLF
jgi:hypothetical protein